MNIIQSTNGTVIEMPYTGCYAGCAQNYCYIFGTEVPPLLFNTITLVAGVITFGVALFIAFWIFKMCRIGGELKC